MRGRRARVIQRILALVLLAGGAGVVGVLAVGGNRTAPVPETEIFEGVRYGCRTLAGDGASGPVHWARVDLAAPGIGLYVTPTDPDLANTDFAYRLRFPATVARREGLALAVNACLFTREPYMLPGYWPGQRARGVETVVSDGRTSHIWEHTYLLWFDERLTPRLEQRKPPPAEALARAQWAVGGQGVGLSAGRVGVGAGGEPRPRTAIGIDAQQKLLFLAVFEAAEPARALRELAALGARDGMLLDGGGSTCMVIGAGATGARPGTVLGGRRPVATHFGVRARPKAAP